MKLDGALGLYDAFAADYDDSFEAVSLRRTYDRLAWEHVERLLPGSPGLVVDVGCGTGRAVARCLAAGHRVIGLEPAPGMRAVLARKFDDPRFTLLATGVEDAELPLGEADAVIALGSVQYAADPAAAIRRMASWLKPGGALCAYVDGLVALTLELLRIGRTEEALRRLADGWGVFSHAGHEARLQLFDRATLIATLEAAGLRGVEARGLLVTISALGREACEAALARDEAAFMALERTLAGSAAMADAGKHVIAWGRRPT
jgi:SAM-dependent methyltransferase